MLRHNYRTSGHAALKGGRRGLTNGGLNLSAAARLASPLPMLALRRFAWALVRAARQRSYPHLSTNRAVAPLQQPTRHGLIVLQRYNTSVERCSNSSDVTRPSYPPPPSYSMLP